MELTKQEKLSAIMHTAEECGAKCTLKYHIRIGDFEHKIKMSEWHFNHDKFYYEENYCVKTESIVSINIEL